MQAGQGVGAVGDWPVLCRVQRRMSVTDSNALLSFPFYYYHHSLFSAVTDPKERVIYLDRTR
jgi:hypothetical protein